MIYLCPCTWCTYHHTIMEQNPTRFSFNEWCPFLTKKTSQYMETKPPQLSAAGREGASHGLYDCDEVSWVVSLSYNVLYM